ncbi:MAG: adenylosuccinate synthase [Candidatus Tectomicrobia bacterium]|uniref:Adenylosuccinate synthetase n=1 Tax=Tectimicrobiota bacterium TaxID=2528274 RepID=A0A933LQ71_UNCTE|nr:adenylosuccinate synthase [Candidatus Tectomicrobia bacterium]
MATIVVVGAQWGDEGKGKIVDFLTEKADVIARYQGGSNAGHTVIVGDEKFVLHLIPSGIIHDGKKCLIGAGVVLEPETLFQEIGDLESRGIKVAGNLYISSKAHLVMPYHLKIDLVSEKYKGNGKIGTTGRGIGPAYADKMARIGFRVCELLEDELFRERLQLNLREKNVLLKYLYHEDELVYEDILTQYRLYAQKLYPFVADTTKIIRNTIELGQNLLVEGAQGAMLDIDQGTYPYVTSSTTSVGGACSGLGLPPNKIDEVLGIYKAYATRVGGGPFPTELKDQIGELLRKRGLEFGATTGRPRRCGWFDAVAAKYSAWINGLSSMAITKLDVLDVCSTIGVCTGYQYKNEILEAFPDDSTVLENCRPVYKEIDGWNKSTSGITSYAKLPDKAKIYLNILSELLEIDISLISTGPQRHQTVVAKGIF